MNHYPITISASNTDVGALNIQGTQLLGAGMGAVVGLVAGKGKLVPLALGAGLGYLVAHTTFFQKIVGPTGVIG